MKFSSSLLWCPRDNAGRTLQMVRMHEAEQYAIPLPGRWNWQGCMDVRSLVGQFWMLHYEKMLLGL
jgi:hypothetical protein